jgi:hypothetical protein
LTGNEKSGRKIAKIWDFLPYPQILIQMAANREADRQKGRREDEAVHLPVRQDLDRVLGQSLVELIGDERVLEVEIGVLEAEAAVQGDIKDWTGLGIIVGVTEIIPIEVDGGSLLHHYHHLKGVEGTMITGIIENLEVRVTGILEILIGILGDTGNVRTRLLRHLVSVPKGSILNREIHVISVLWIINCPFIAFISLLYAIQFPIVKPFLLIILFKIPCSCF